MFLFFCWSNMQPYPKKITGKFSSHSMISQSKGLCYPVPWSYIAVFLNIWCRHCLNIDLWTHDAEVRVTTSSSSPYPYPRVKSGAKFLNKNWPSHNQYIYLFCSYQFYLYFLFIFKQCLHQIFKNTAIYDQGTG